MSNAWYIVAAFAAIIFIVGTIVIIDSHSYRIDKLEEEVKKLKDK